MARWEEIEREAPEFAARVRALFEAGTNKTIATLRRDGSPRISASEAEFTDGEITFGMMPDSLKLRDIRRDPRLAMHSPTLEPPPGDPSAGPGDAKLAGRAVEIPPPADTPHVGAGFFRIDIQEVALTYVGTPADHLVIESWHPSRGHHRRTRA
ncbi:pyridoxamine 5'-phosphate oxidase family protein [Actinoplanes derwentensis]|uniref:Pyridoxamine 5'-phosphate oxidase n=1 Tax=Actinoplanes derwentensis TaxID=113562 RepID=A0A1H2D4R0_9ACTN|nr:pyridoxamine 5'-phosphate oxidase family protein [Actinoplanes derwentensis]GID85407.1 pyridoxamine 5'-phosphate oxidase [Actinoplanes derwentensis]SDT77723.1 Pyridoxamine 5'-phosphate oxidase [Actinoplanes derwentensis]